MKKIIYSIIVSVFVITSGSGYVSAMSVAPTATVRSITATSAVVSVSPDVLRMLDADDTTGYGVYFEYSEPDQMCIMIYPTPEHCKPKKTAPGVLQATLTNLKPSTRYSVLVKRDNTIRCVTTPCPSNEFQSAPRTFTTLSTSVDTTPHPDNQVDDSNVLNFPRDLKVGSRGDDVIALQNFLRERGYFITSSTGYYGHLTRAAVRLYQRNDMRIAPTGTVGPKTRIALTASTTVQEETFTGKITAVSTACFADGECSVTVDGKKVVTTIGWSQATVGSIKGRITDIGSLENQIGADVKVYAKKTAEGYTLYGSNKYYIEVL